MAGNNDQTFEPKPGRPKNSKAPNIRFAAKVTRAATMQGNRLPVSRAPKSCRFNARGRGRDALASMSFDHGWSMEGGSRYRARRVVVKARIVTLKGAASRASQSHIAYLKRDGVSMEGDKGRFFDAKSDEADSRAFVKRGQDDRHHFRFIVAPEDAGELSSLKDFTRDLMKQVEADVNTRLDWIAAEHHNTGHPHVHVVARGITDDGKILYIAGDYIAKGIRERASQGITLELGPQSEWEAQQKLAKDVRQHRFTALDRSLLAATQDGVIDLRNSESRQALVGISRHSVLGRLEALEKLGLAQEREREAWAISSRLETDLRALGQREETYAIMQKALSRNGIPHRPADLIVDRDKLDEPVIGRVIGKGLTGDWLDERPYLVLDATDGKAHYLEVSANTDLKDITANFIVEVTPRMAKAADRMVSAFAERNHGLYTPSQHQVQLQAAGASPDPEGLVEATVRRLEVLRRDGMVERLGSDTWTTPPNFIELAAGYENSRNTPGLSVKVLSSVDLKAQISAEAATWLDRQMLSREPHALSERGFGFQVEKALEQRKEYLLSQGHLQRQGDNIVYRKNLLATLQQSEVGRVGGEMATARTDGLPFRPMQEGERISGTFRSTVQLASGKFAIIENHTEFTLVPYRPVLDRMQAKQVNGLVRGQSVSWELGRSRGLGIG